MKALLLALKYLPTILEGVVAVEKVIGAGNGASKRELILGSIQAAAKTGQKVDQEEVVIVTSLIDHVVNILNASGVFKKGEAK